MLNSPTRLHRMVLQATELQLGQKRSNGAVVGPGVTKRYHDRRHSSGRWSPSLDRLATTNRYAKHSLRPSPPPKWRHRYSYSSSRFPEKNGAIDAQRDPSQEAQDAECRHSSRSPTCVGSASAWIRLHGVVNHGALAEHPRT